MQTTNVELKYGISLSIKLKIHYYYAAGFWYLILNLVLDQKRLTFKFFNRKNFISTPLLNSQFLFYSFETAAVPSPSSFTLNRISSRKIEYARKADANISTTIISKI